MSTTSALTTIAVDVLLFARYAELLGTDHLELALPAGATVGSALEVIRARPGGDGLPPTVLVARNLEQVDEKVVLAAGDELALLPPLAGG